MDVQVFQAFGQRAGDLVGALGQDGVGDRDAGRAEQVVLALAFGGVLLLQGGGDLPVVAFDGGEGVVGQALGEQRRRDAEQGVADADVLVQVRQRLAGLHGLQPERDLSQLGGHGVEVHAVDAAADHAAQRSADHGLGRFGLAGFLGGDPLGDPAGGRDEEVAGAAGGVADGEAPAGPRPALPGFRARSLVQQRVQRGVEQALDQRGRRVVGTDSLRSLPGRTSRV